MTDTLGRLRMSIDDSTKAYIFFSGPMFQKNRHYLTVNGDDRCRFNSDEAQRVVKEVIEVLKAERFLKDAIRIDVSERVTSGTTVVSRPCL
jgi:hypothetical protein